MKCSTSTLASRTVASNASRRASRRASQRADSALGSRSRLLFDGCMCPRVANTCSASRGGQMRDQHRALACRERRPVPLDDAGPAFQRRHRPLTAPGPIQRAGHRDWTGGGEVGLGAATGPAMHLAVDEHQRQVQTDFPVHDTDLGLAMRVSARRAASQGHVQGPSAVSGASTTPSGRL